MSEMQGKQRSAVVFGARNLGRAVIELLVSDGWAVTGVARSRSTLDGVSASGALALKADVTDPASVYDVLEQAAAAHGGVEFVLNAAAAYGGERTGPFGGGPIAAVCGRRDRSACERSPTRPRSSCAPTASRSRC
jgi:NAD(P)-dependent dehydrogenase (short-subunit alcohol dehydrogenase family)